MPEDIVLFRIDRKVGLLILAGLAVVIGGLALAEQLTLTTSYPVPSGIYNQLITTGNGPTNTIFNRNGGNTILVPGSNSGGMVGIGTDNPVAKLSVNGGVQLGNETTCSPGKAGTLRWNGSAVQSCNGSAWAAVGGGSPARVTLTADGPTMTWAWSTAYVSCPSGYAVTGGGGGCYGGWNAPAPSMISNININNAWIVSCFIPNGSGASITARATVHCSQ